MLFFQRKCANLNPVRQRPFQRWFVALGIIAMLGSLAAVPMTTSVAFAMAGMTGAAQPASAMPCHPPAKPCPECPQQACPDMGACLVSCFQPLAPPVAEVRLQGTVVSSLVLPAPPEAATASLVPLLLRPPRV